MELFHQTYQVPKEEQDVIHPEINLAKWPQIFAPRQTKQLSREIIRGDAKVTIGKQITNKGKEVEVGILLVSDYLVLNGLIQLWEIEGQPENTPVAGRVREFITKILKREPSGKAFADLEQSLKRLVDTPLNWEKAFFDSRTGQLESIVNYKFRFLQELKTTKSGFDGKKLEFRQFAFRFNQSFLSNLLSGATKPLNFSELRSLNNEISILAYSFLDLVMSQRTHWSRRITAFVLDDLNIPSKRNEKPTHCRKLLERVARELRGRNLSSGRIKSVYIKKTNDGLADKLVVVKEPFQRAPKLSSAKNSAGMSDETEEIVNLLANSLGRQKNKGFYYLIAQKCPRDIINTAMRDTVDAFNAGEIKTSKAAYFGWWIQELAQARGIDLGLKSRYAVKAQETSSTGQPKSLEIDQES